MIITTKQERLLVLLRLPASAFISIVTVTNCIALNPSEEEENDEETKAGTEERARELRKREVHYVGVYDPYCGDLPGGGVDVVYCE